MTLLNHLPDGTYRRDANGDVTFDASEFELIENTCCVSPLDDLALIRVTGVDARAFLHGQFVSDVLNLDLHTGQLSAWCTPKGRVSFLFHLVAGLDGFSILVPGTDAEPLVKRLRMFVLRAKVVIDLADNIAILGISAPRRASLAPPLAEFPLRWRSRLVSDLTVMGIDDSRRFLLWGEVAAVLAWWNACGLQRVGTAAWRALDIQNQHPRLVGGAIDAFLPQELNLDLSNSVSFDKGCYPGQEIIARVKYRGDVKSRLKIGSVTAPAPAGTKLYRGTGGSAGEIITSVTAPTGGTRFLAVVELNAVAGPVGLADLGGPRVEWADRESELG